MSEGNSNVARRICVVQGQNGFPSKIEIISLGVKDLKVSTERFCFSAFLVSYFYKLPIVIQEAFIE